MIVLSVPLSNLLPSGSTSSTSKLSSNKCAMTPPYSDISYSNCFLQPCTRLILNPHLWLLGLRCARIYCVLCSRSITDSDSKQYWNLVQCKNQLSTWWDGTTDWGLYRTPRQLNLACLGGMNKGLNKFQFQRICIHKAAIERKSRLTGFLPDWGPIYGTVISTKSLTWALVDWCRECRNN